MQPVPTIYILRHGKLLLPYQGHEDMPFAIFASLGRGELDPIIDQAACQSLVRDLAVKVPFPKVRKILVSPSQRSQSTGQLLKEYLAAEHNNVVDIAVVPELREVYFDLERILPGTGDRQFPISELNEAVFRAMVNGNGAESIQETVARAREAVRHLVVDGPTIAVTHDFFMRVLELCIRARGADRMVTLEDLKSTQRNGYLRGFATERTLETLVSI